MHKTILPIAALLASIALILMGNGLQGTLLPVRADIAGFSAVAIGLLASFYYLGFTLGCTAGSRLVRRVGHIRTFAAMAAIVSAVVLAQALFIHPASWWLFRAVTGCCFAILFVVTESWLNSKATNENRGVVFAVYLIVNQGVIAIGQTLIMLGNPADLTLFLVASILMSLSVVPVAMTRSPAPEPIADVRIRVGRLFSQSPVAVVACLAIGLSNGGFWALAPVYALGGSGTTVGVALFMTVPVLAGALGQLPLGRLSDLIDRRLVIFGAAAGASLSGIALATQLEGWGGATFVLVFFYGLCAFPLYSVSVAHMNDFVDRDGFVEAAGGLLFVFGVGAILGPLFASLQVRMFGLDSLFLYLAVVHATLAAFAVYRMTRRAPVPAEAQGAFVDAIRVAQTISTVDPLSTAREGDPGPHV